MDARQQGFFRDLLLSQRNELQARISSDFELMRAFEPTSDPSDLGTVEEQRQWQLRLLEREKSCWTRSTKPWSALHEVSTGGARTPASPSA